MIPFSLAKLINQVYHSLTGISSYSLVPECNFLYSAIISELLAALVITANASIFEILLFGLNVQSLYPLKYQAFATILIASYQGSVLFTSLNLSHSIALADVANVEINNQDKTKVLVIFFNNVFLFIILF